MMRVIAIAIEWIRAVWMMLTLLLIGAIASNHYHPLSVCLLVEPLARGLLDGADLTYLSVALIAVSSSAAVLILSASLWAIAALRQTNSVAAVIRDPGTSI